MTIDDYLKELYFKIEKRNIVIFLSSVIAGILAHGMALFNKYSFHDDAYSLFTVGATFTSGRYMLYELSGFVQRNFGGLFSTPLYEGLITIVVISFSCMFLTSLLNIKSKVLCGCIAFFMICFPSVTGMMGFMFTSVYYALAIFFTVLGSYIICKYKKWHTLLMGVVLIGNAIGIYQAYIPIFLSIYILCYFNENFERIKEDKLASPFKSILYYVLASILPILVYLFTNNIELVRYGKTLSSYKGIDKMGQMSAGQFIVRLGLSYKRFFFPRRDLFPTLTYSAYLLAIFICITLSLYLIFTRLNKNAIILMASLMAILCIPFSFNFSYIMINEEQSVGTLQSYGYVMVIVWLGLLLSRLEEEKIKIKVGVCGVGILTMVFMIITYIRLNNVVYLKAEIMKERSLAYYTELITRIKSVKGYDDTLPIAYIKKGEIEDSTIRELPVWDYFYIHPYCDIDYNINYAWWGYIDNWLGFSATRIDAEPFEVLEEVKNMPSYPDDGSIKIIDGTVVVKLADNTNK